MGAKVFVRHLHLHITHLITHTHHETLVLFHRALKVNNLVRVLQKLITDQLVPLFNQSLDVFQSERRIVFYGFQVSNIVLSLHHEI